MCYVSLNASITSSFPLIPTITPVCSRIVESHLLLRLVTDSRAGGARKIDGGLIELKKDFNEKLINSQPVDTGGLMACFSFRLWPTIGTEELSGFSSQPINEDGSTTQHDLCATGGDNLAFLCPVREADVCGVCDAFLRFFQISTTIQ